MSTVVVAQTVPVEKKADDPAAELSGKKAQSISELEALAKDLTVSKDKAHDLEVSIKTLEKST